MEDLDGLEALDDQVAALEGSLEGASNVAQAFDAELIKMRNTLGVTGREVDTLSQGMDRGLRKALDGVIFDGMKFSDAMRQVSKSLIDATYSAAAKPVTQHFGDMFGSLVGGAVDAIVPFAKGGSFAQGRVTPFATGGIVSGPTMFSMRAGTGLMGEAGPEAIMPLTRGRDGKLGVRSEGGGRPVNVVMNISTPDVDGFRRSQSQISAQMSRALGLGQRNR